MFVMYLPVGRYIYQSIIDTRVVMASSDVSQDDNSTTTTTTMTTTMTTRAPTTTAHLLDNDPTPSSEQEVGTDRLCLTVGNFTGSVMASSLVGFNVAMNQLMDGKKISITPSVYVRANMFYLR